MVNLEALSKRAETSEDGEAFLPIARRPGGRVGVGARAGPGRSPDFFVEVVLDLFPDRPRVSPSRMETGSAILEWLRLRGYSLACDDAGVITCERSVDPIALPRELGEVGGVLDWTPKRGGSRLRA